MADFPIEQALFHWADGSGARLVRRSAGFGDDWVAEAEALLGSFADRAGQVSCPEAVFAYPFGPKQVAVVQVASRPGQDGRMGLGFYLLILPRKAYESFIADPFVVVRKQPAPWSDGAALSTLYWPAVPLPPRTVQEVQRVLQRVKASALPEDVDPQTVVLTADNSESPALLGGVQVLVDGGRLVFERPQPDTELLASLWTLLPYSTAGRLWPASFAFNTSLDFDVVVVPRAGDNYPGYLHEEQAADYPPGRYELALQMAAEAGNQAELDALFCRRSLADTWRMGIILLVFLGILALMARLIRPVDHLPVHQTARVPKAAAAAGSIAVGDPWTAMGIIHYGNILWRPQENQP